MPDSADEQEDDIINKFEELSPISPHGIAVALSPVGAGHSDVAVSGALAGSPRGPSDAGPQ